MLVRKLIHEIRILKSCGVAEAVGLRPFREIPHSIPSQSVLNLWWMKCQWYNFLSEYFGFTLLGLFHPVLRIHVRRTRVGSL